MSTVALLLSRAHARYVGISVDTICLLQVRRAAAQHLAKFAAVVEPEFVGREFVAHFHQLTQDGARAEGLVLVVAIDAVAAASSRCRVQTERCGDGVLVADRWVYNLQVTQSAGH